MSEMIASDVCVIGAGSGGLTAAYIAARLGARTVLFEQSKMGGECLNTGCVPSKALIASARAAAEAERAVRLGVHTAPDVDFTAVMEHVRRAIAAIAPHASKQRFEQFGVEVIPEHARFTGRKVVAGATCQVRARRFVIATGSRPAIPSIPGLEKIAYLTNESLFSLAERPQHLLIIGAGPIGAEMAQAFARLGSRVTLLDAARLLPKDAPELVDRLRAQLISDGVSIRENAHIADASTKGADISIGLATGEQITGSHLLVAAGRKPNTEGLGLDNAGIDFDEAGIKVNASLRTRNRHVYAIGDVAGGPQFTHIASYQAEIVIRSALFGLQAKTDYRALPWVTYTDPELAHAGLTLEQAQCRFGKKLRVLTHDFADNDRAQTDAAFPGLMKLIVKPNGTILGASLLGAHAGELIHPWALAMSNNLKLTAFMKTILPYPTLGEISKAAVQEFYAPKVFSWLPKVFTQIRLRLG